MSNTYQNVSNQNGRVKFVAVANEGQEYDLYFNSASASVPVAGGARVPVITQKVSLQTQKDVTCGESQCVKAYIGNGAKMEFTAERGDTVGITALLDEMERVLSIWRAKYNADQGLPPPVHATFAPEGE